MTISTTPDSATERTPTPGKPIEIEGVLDIYLIRPLGALIVAWLKHTRMTPNAVSWWSVAAAAGAAAAFYDPSWAGAALGAALLLLSSGLDSADGQLARATGRTTELGETLDGFCDSLSFGAIYVSAAMTLIFRFDVSPWLAVLLGLVAGFSHSIQSALVDYERQLFVYFTRGTGRIERENPARLRDEFLKARRAGEGRLPVLLRWLRTRYCMNQQALLSSSTALLRAYDAIRGDAERRARFLTHYRTAMRWPLHAWTLMAPNCHKVAIVVCAFLPTVAPDWAPSRYGLALVLVFNIALDVVLLLLIAMQRRVDRRLMHVLLAEQQNGATVARP